MEQTKVESRAPVRTGPKPINKSSFRELYPSWDIGYYAAAAIVYFLLGLAFRDKVLNIGVGPLFFVVWIWIAPPVWQWVMKRVNGR